MEQLDIQKKLLNYAYRLLARQDYSEFKLKQKLFLRSQDSVLIEEVIQTIKSQGFMREENYKRLKIKSRLKQGRSVKFIQEELAQEKVYTEKVNFEEAYLELGTSPEEIIEQLILKKIRRIDVAALDFESKMKLKNKILSSLARLGHSFDQCQKILKKHSF